MFRKSRTKLTPRGWLSWSKPGIIRHFSLLIISSNPVVCYLPIKASYLGIARVSRLLSYSGSRDGAQD
jgi:hypothetical protein